MLCSRLLRPGLSQGRLSSLLDAGFTLLERGYRRSLALALRARWGVVVAAILATAVGAQLATQVALEFTPRSDRSEFEANVELPIGTGMAQTKEVARRAGERIRELDQVSFTFATIGGGSQEQVNQVHFYVKLTPKAERSQSQFEVMAEVRRALAEAAPEARSTSVTEVPWVSGGGYEAFAIDYALLGPDLDRLQELAEQIAQKLRQSGQFVDVKTSFNVGKPEVQASIDRRRAAALGIRARSLAATLRSLIGGVKVATYEEGGERYDVRVRLEEAQRDELAELGLLQVRAGDGRLSDLDNVATLRVASGPVQINRQNRSRQIVVNANLPPGVAMGTAADLFKELVGQVELPDGYVGETGGDEELMRETVDAIQFAFALALVSLYMILASQFNSFVQPVVVMLTAPLSFIGAFAALRVSGEALSLFAQIGVVILMGLVMKNGILLVDYTNQLRQGGASASAAALDAGAVRLRPVLMTTVSTILGMLPLALSRTDGAEFRNGMGVLIIGGLLSSMFLTLFVVPVVYTLIESARAAVGRLAAGSRAPSPEASRAEAP